MGRSINYALATETLNSVFEDANRWHIEAVPEIPAEIVSAADTLFGSATKSYREVVLGCCLARLIDQTIDIRNPYSTQSDNAFSGRTLDEKVINPFLHSNQIPCSKGPYLATFRRGVSFTEATRIGLRDQDGYNALLRYLEFIEEANANGVRFLLTYLLYRFLVLREAENIQVYRIARLSMEQLNILIRELLTVPSGGLLPVLVVVSTLETIQAGYGLPWVISRQGINEADAATGAEGDVTVRIGEEILLAIEVTERPVGRERVVSTFNTKIMTNAIRDYIFATTTPPDNEARAVARSYFAQGHEINFVDIATWSLSILVTFGSEARERFMNAMTDALSERAVSATIKRSWNQIVERIIQSTMNMLEK